MTTSVSTNVNIKIVNIREVKEKYEKYLFDVNMVIWKDFFIKNMKLFEKGSNKWVGFPSFAEDKNGKKEYSEINGWKNPKVTSVFKEQVLHLVLQEIEKGNYIKADQNPSNKVPF